RFPELFRDLTMKGATTIFVVAEWPLARKQHWETLLRARAIENQGYIIASNTYGEIVDQTFAGRSMIIGPFGDVEDEADARSEAVFTGTTYGSEVDWIREDVPIFDRRKREMYHFLLFYRSISQKSILYSIGESSSSDCFLFFNVFI